MLKLAIIVLLSLPLAAQTSTFAGYTGGGCGSSPTCNVTVTNNTTVQATFNLTQQGFTILNQPSPDGPAWYPNGIASFPLPNVGRGGPTGFLMPNSDAMVAALTAETSNGGIGIQPTSVNGGFITGQFSVPGLNDYNAQPLYVSRASDPVYRPANIKFCGSEFAPQAVKNSSGFITNITFHAPNGAQFSQYGTGGVTGTSDELLSVWDLSGIGISNNKALGFYANSSSTLSLPTCPESAAASPDGQAHACTESDPGLFNAQGAGPYCSWGDVVSGKGYGEGSATSSNSFGPYSADLRYLEILSGHAYHASNMGTSCESTAGGTEPNTVFPNTESTGACKCSGAGGSCSSGLINAMSMPNGALLFLDYTDTQLACMDPNQPSVQCVGSDGKAVAKLSPFQFLRIEQLSHYGWYEADTSGPSTQVEGLSAHDHGESSQAWLYYSNHGFSSPNAFTGTCSECFQTIANYLNNLCSGSFTNPLNPCYGGGGAITDPATRWLERVFYNLPFGFSGPTCTATAAAAGNCGVAKHLHFADPCVAVGQAGLTTGTNNTGSKTWTACTSPSTYQVAVTILGSGSGTISSTIPFGPTRGLTPINCTGTNGTSCGNPFYAYSLVVLSAVPSPGNTFAGWTGCPSVVNGNQCSVRVSKNFTGISATFN